MTSVGWLLTRFSKPKGKDRYVTVRTFSQTDSNTISSALKSGSNKVYFGDDEGVISIDGNTNFKNGLTGISDPALSTLLPNNIVNSDSVDDKYVFSKPNGKWILYCQNKDNLFLLQNPVPRPEWDICYKNASNVTVQQTIQSCLKTDGKDPVCKYLDGDNEEPDDNFCMNDLLTPATRKVMKKGDRTGYANILSFCDCSKKGYDTFPFIKTYRTNTPCPSSLAFSVCNTSIDAGRDLKAGNVNIEQKCGANQTNAPSSMGGSPPTGSPPTGSPPTGSPPTGSPPTGSPPTGSPPTGSPPTELPPSDLPPSESPATFLPTKFSLSTLTMTQKLIIGGVILLIVILILVLALSGDDDRPPMPYGQPYAPQPMPYPPMQYPPMRSLRTKY
jgi:hypothetical protein